MIWGISLGCSPRHGSPVPQRLCELAPILSITPRCLRPLGQFLLLIREPASGRAPVVGLGRQAPRTVSRHLRGGHTKLGTASCFFTLPDAVTGRSFLLSPPSAFCFPVSGRDWPGTGHTGGARGVSECGSRNLKHSCPLNGTPAWDMHCSKPSLAQVTQRCQGL